MQRVDLQGRLTSYFQSLDGYDVYQRITGDDIRGRRVDRRGELFVLCPSAQHSDVHPSAHYDPRTGRIKCFQCGFGGGFIAMVIGAGHATTKAEAVSWLASGASTAYRGKADYPDVVRRGSASKKLLEEKVTAEFDYRDLDGKIVYQVQRLEGVNAATGNPDKRFRQRVPRRPGRGWLWKGPEEWEKVPYRLPQLAAAVSRGESIWVPEGEKCVLSIVRFGLIGTTIAGGTSAEWISGYTFHMNGARSVYVLTDSSPDGRRVARERAWKIRLEIKPRVPVYTVDFFPARQNDDDVDDWFTELGDGSIEAHLSVFRRYVRSARVEMTGAPLEQGA